MHQTKRKNNEIKNEILEALKNSWPEDCTKNDIIASLSDKGVKCADGTFYNIISKLLKQNRVISTRSSSANYKYNKSKNENHPIGDVRSTIVTERGFVNRVMELICANGFEEICKIHDIHLKTDFWDIEEFEFLRQRSCERWHHERCYVWRKNDQSKSWIIYLRVGDSYKVTFQVYSKGVLACSINCTRTPFPENLEGLRALQNVINEACLIIFDDRKFWTFSNVDDWIVTSWHRGRDSKQRFADRFEVTFRSFFGGLARIYVRKEDGRLRVEESQSPRMVLGLLLHRAELGGTLYSDENFFSEFEKRIEKIVEDKLRACFMEFIRPDLNLEY